VEELAVEARAEEGRNALAGSTELARNALGLPQILFCIVTGSAPLAAMLFNDPLGIRGIGIGIPAAFWLSTVAFAFFSVAYVEMARRVTTAGGMYSYMSYGFGRVIGLATAVSLLAAYALFVPGINGITTYFAQVNVLNLSGGFDMDWRIYAFCFIFLMFAVSYFRVESVAKFLGLALIGEILVLMIFSFAVVVRGGGPDGLEWQALNPASLFNGGAGIEGADRVFGGVGGAAAGVGFFAAFWSWVGFETAPNYAEEARNPKRMMAYAIYISCIGLGILYTFWSWMLISSYGASNDQALWAVAAQLGIDPENGPTNAGIVDGNYGSVFYPVVHKFAGVGIENLFQVLIITGSFACCLAFWNTTCRYIFAMGREGILPRFFGRTHAKHKSPFVAAIALLVFTCGVTAMFALGGAGTGFQEALGITTSSALVPLYEIATWLPFQGNTLLFPIMALVDLAIIVYFWREARDGFHWFKTFVAPIVGAGAIAFAVYLMQKNRAFLTTGTYEGWTKAVPYYALGIFLGGCALALVYRWRAKDRYEAAGRFVHEEV
jgi:amino acid transporter